MSFIGVAINDTIWPKPARDSPWPECDSHFQFKTNEGVLYTAQIKMRPTLATTINVHRVGMYYPLHSTPGAAFKLDSIDGNMGVGSIVWRGQTRVRVLEQQTMNLNELLLVSQYSTKCHGSSKTQQSSFIPTISKLSPSKLSPSKMNPVRPVRRPITAIAVGPLDLIMTQLYNLSPSHDNPVTLVITHQPVSGLCLRKFDDMDSLSLPNAFKPQGSMSMNARRNSCGVEAVFNVGFTVDANTFNEAPSNVDLSQFVEDSPTRPSRDSYLHETGGGNDIPTHVMHNVLQWKAPHLVIQNDYHNLPLGESSFWVDRQFAVILIPVCGGHYVSIERIDYNNQTTWCLREGRGNVLLDFINFPNGGNPQRYIPNAASKKRGLSHLQYK